MLPKEFTSSKTGNVVSLPEGHSFIPDRLFPRLELNQALLKALGQARGALGEFVGEARLVENQDLIIHPLAVREAVLSNKIEGTHTAVAGVLLQQAGELPSDPLQRNNQTEVLNYLKTLKLGSQRISDSWPLGQQLVRSLQKELLANNRGCDSSLGQYRDKQVYIGSRKSDIRQALKEARYVPPPPEHVQPAMDDLFDKVSGAPEYDPLIDCGILHYQFEAIHPFEDGNGRMGRLLIPLYLMSKGVLDRPYLYLSSFLQDHQDLYVDYMKEISTHGSWVKWINFFLEAVESQANESKFRVRKILSLDHKYRSLVIQETRSQAPLAAISLIMERVFVTTKDVELHAKCTNPTARAALDSLTKLKVLVRLENRYPHTWVAEELLNEVYNL